MNDTKPVVNYLKDYMPPAFEIESIDLTFDLHPAATVVTNHMVIKRIHEIDTLILQGEGLVLKSVILDGEECKSQCKQTDSELIVPVSKANFELTIVTEINPENNTALEGLYRSNGNYCTQCEAEGFRRITYFLDRPDVLTFFTTKIIADQASNAVLLSNGNLVEAGDLPDGRHYAVWHDPFKKSCYLFALVAGNLQWIEDGYITKDNRSVVLRIYVEPQNIDKCDHAMTSLKKSMQWDEDRFGLVYDLDIYMIVAVDDFNMGAMENKGLNVFNSKFVLAKPETATDVDYEGIEAVIGHEYFHNWTGNRVTCRDWFQLTLKEGLTVFRDQEFTADMLSPAVKRIEDVKRLRSYQFPEDAGPMSHPIQPQSYIEMNNFYTMTVYEKGAEVVRLYHTLLGESGFRKGMDLYFKRHDGSAVTVGDFRSAMADANDVDLSQMHHWYVQPGTPVLDVTSVYDASAKTYTLNCRQSLEKMSDDSFQPLLIPLKVALFDMRGQVVPLCLGNEAVDSVTSHEGEVVLRLTEREQQFVFHHVDEAPIPSLLRGFSAPVILNYPYTDEELSLLASHDSDSFVRWESFQRLALNEIKTNIARYEDGHALHVSDALKSAYKALLIDNDTDPALIALAMTLPDLTYIGEQYKVVNVDAVYHVHHWLRTLLAELFEADLLACYTRLFTPEREYLYHKDAIAKRKLQNACLKYLAMLPNQFERVEKQFYDSSNMTDVLAALEAISHTDHAQRVSCLEYFYQQWKTDPLVLDKWFTLQAASHHQHALEHVKELVLHPDFKYTNPNRVRSVLGVFGRLNLLGFHRADGSGYSFLADQVIKLDAVNPQVAARMVSPFTQWKRYDSKRSQAMLAELQRIISVDGLSKDVYEIVSKSLEVAEGLPDM